MKPVHVSEAVVHTWDTATHSLMKSVINLFSVCLLQFVWTVSAKKVWASLALDRKADCMNETIYNDALKDGDAYEVTSDSWKGRPPKDKVTAMVSPCINVFNFGGRVASVNVKLFQCPNPKMKPYLEIYDECKYQPRHYSRLLAKINCSSVASPDAPRSIHSSSSCISVHHHRTKLEQGFFFSLEVVAGHELFVFPTAEIAAIITTSVVIIMLVIKIVCVISGYESRLPKLNIDPEEAKQMLENLAETVIHIHPPSENENEEASETSRQGQRLVFSADQTGHSVLKVTRSTGSSHRSSSAEYSSDLDYDFLDVPLDGPSTPRLKRYGSVRASSIWRPTK